MAGWAAAGPSALGKKVEGHVTLAPNQAKIVTKFCFDFNQVCKTPRCEDEEPGLIDIDVFAGHSSSSSSSSPVPSAPVATATPAMPGSAGLGTKHLGGLAASAAAKAGAGPKEVMFVLLDDEYKSFPEVEEVWTEVQCRELMRFAKGSISLPWKSIAEPVPSNVTHFKKHIVEKIRPRWWYLAFASCSNSSLDFSYRLHMRNQLQGMQSEFSMNVVGAIWWSVLLTGAAGYLSFLQVRSAKAWLQASSSGPGTIRASLLRLHPAVLLLTAATILAAVGQAAWFFFLQAYMMAGTADEWLRILGRAGLTSSKTLLSILLLLFAHGQCVCTPDVAWREHRELLAGLVLFGISSFWLETWADSDTRIATTEYVYDSRPGVVLVAFDLLWLWLCLTRTWKTYQAETRLKPKLFYKRYGPLFLSWFAALPIVAAVGTVLAPWVRFRVFFAVNGALVAGVLGVLVQTMKPDVASKHYEMRTNEYQPVSAEELDKFLQEEDDEDI